jgi:hypothetical protein
VPPEDSRPNRDHAARLDWIADHVKQRQNVDLAINYLRGFTGDPNEVLHLLVESKVVKSIPRYIGLYQ